MKRTLVLSCLAPRALHVKPARGELAANLEEGSTMPETRLSTPITDTEA